MESEIYIFLRNYCNLIPIKNILITSSGDKNNILSCILKGIQDNTNIPENCANVYYIETNIPRYEQARNKYAFMECLKPFNSLSINIKDIADTNDDSLNYLKKIEIEYILKNNINQDQITKILTKQNNFDLVVFNSNKLLTEQEYNLLLNKSNAYLFTSIFYNYNNVINNLKNNKDCIMIYSNSEFIMFIKKELQHFFNYD